jgi:phage baseplate assembly protein W
MSGETETLLGRGLTIPFQRVGGDFTYAEGSALLRSMIKQILMTEKGELRWDPEFGLSMSRYRHKPITATMVGEIQAEIVDGLLKYVPNIEVVDVEVGKDTIQGQALIIKTTWRAVIRERSRNLVLTDEQSTEVKI